RCRPSTRRVAGVVGRHLRLLNQDDVVVGEGTSAVLVRARSEAAADPSRAWTDFCAPAWADELARRLSSERTFVDATDAFDGAIGLACGAESIQLRVYRGAVIDTARSTPEGPT